VLWPKHLALLLYLALSPGRRRTRDHLLGLLWGEKPESQARHALNEALRSLRAALGAPRLVSVADALELSDEALEVDALRFNTLAESDPAAADAILTGDFLEGFSVPGAHAFEEWVTTERDRYRTRGAAVLTALGEQALAACQFTPARDLAQRSLALQP
jgi:DNA-binding SARP family transcriptional activator